MTLALRTQQVLANESGVTETIDPLAGSYYLESLTDEIEKRAEAYINKIDEMGGSVKAIEKGFFQDEIAKASYEYQQAIEQGDKIIVGVNAFREKERSTPPMLKVTEEQEKHQVQNCSMVKAQRDGVVVRTNLEALTAAARAGANLMPYILAAVEAYASVGEISDALRTVYGEY